MRLHQYKSYRQYKKVQIKKNKRKVDTFWAAREVMDAVAEYVRANTDEPRFGLCHGAKAGFECALLEERLDKTRVLGTDISPTARTFERMIQWDFHDVKDEWVGAVDFIYSNALDHSYDPAMCLDQWMRCLTKAGYCFLEWSEYHDERSGTPDDPFAASLNEYRQLINEKYEVRDEFRVTPSKEHAYPVERCILVVARRA